MHSFSIVRLVGTFLVVGLAAGLLSVSAAGASTATCKPRGPLPRYGSFTAVTATSACNAWALGRYSPESGSGRPRIWHWNGTAWKVQPSPNPGGSSGFPYTTELWGVAATSATNAWAVGGVDVIPGGFGAYNGIRPRTLIEHWNGKTWKVQPTPRTRSVLYGVAVTSATNAWAVGSHVILHWNGTGWKVQQKVFGQGLDAVTATSANNAWAVGAGVILHWNGTGWKVQKKPRGVLNGVTATSATNAWAVGSYKDRTVMLHWNGKAWKPQPSPNPGGSDGNPVLDSVAATSATNAWAVGTYQSRQNDQTLIEHWNGKRWTRQTSPNVSELSGVAATSATNAWAVGGGAILHWNGTAWKG